MYIRTYLCVSFSIERYAALHTYCDIAILGNLAANLKVFLFAIIIHVVPLALLERACMCVCV